MDSLRSLSMVLFALAMTGARRSCRGPSSCTSTRRRCGTCHSELLVAFSCKRCGFCPSCGARRMAESAALLVDEVFPEQPVCQWVLSVPPPLRFLFASGPDLLGRVLGIVYRSIAMHLCAKAGFSRKTAEAGAVTLIQRFGSALNLNVHLLCHRGSDRRRYEEPMLALGQRFTVVENAMIGTLVGAVNATDGDGDALSFTIASGNAHGIFDINSPTDQWSIAKAAVLDFESVQSYSLGITVSDSKVPAKNISRSLGLNVWHQD